MITYVINITPMAVFGDETGNSKGILTLPSKVSKDLVARGFNLKESLVGEFIYAQETKPITITPKHKENKYPALQFTINDPAQYKQLKVDGADSLVVGFLGIKKPKGKVYPALECEITATKPNGGINGIVRIRVINANSANEDRATELMRRFTENNKSISAVANDEIISFESLSQWYDMTPDIRSEFKHVTRCIYILWGTDKKDVTQKKLYVGIIGDAKNSSGKRNLTQRLNEHVKEKTGIIIEKFRFFELINSSYSNIPELLKTLEMRIIQTLSVLIPQKGNKNVEPLVANGKAEIDGTFCTIELINLTYKHHG